MVRASCGNTPSFRVETLSLPEKSRSSHGKKFSRPEKKPSFHGEKLSLPEKKPSFHGERASLPEKKPSFHGETASCHEKTRAFHGKTPSFPEKKPASRVVRAAVRGMPPPRTHSAAPEHRSEQFGVVAFSGLRLGGLTTPYYSVPTSSPETKSAPTAPQDRPH